MHASEIALPPDLAKKLEAKLFWWEAVGSQPRSGRRILAQAMAHGSFADIRLLEEVVGADALADLMLHAEPGWLSDRSWEFWRGRLALATARTIPEEAPRRSFDASAI
jgi:hypothetical protein